MTDPLFDVGVGIMSAAFGAGVAWASLKAKVTATLTLADTAREQADKALALIASEKERSTRQQGEINLCNERLGYLRRDVDELRPAVFKTRFESDRGMPAARPPAPRELPRDERRDDTDPPPIRNRLPSRRDG